MVSTVFKLSVLFLLVGICAGLGVRKPVSRACLACICEASSGCDQSLRCDRDVCGLLRITKPYWIDAGKPTLPGVCSNDTDAYSSCTNDPVCAAETVQGYMKRLGKDCNGDGVVDCYDYMAIHKLGGYGCTAKLPSSYVTSFNKCMSAIAENHRRNYIRDFFVSIFEKLFDF